MEYLDLQDVLGLFWPGVVAGAGLGAIFWLIGYTVSSVYAWIKKS